MSVRLYVGNLPKEVDRQELAAVFAEAGDSVSTKVITDRKTGKCRGFGFVTVKTDEEADQIIEKFNGHAFKDTILKIEKALPRTKGKADDESAPMGEDESTSPEEAAETSSSSSGSNGATPSSGKSNRRKGNKSRKSSGSSSSSDTDESIQPDPRWAQELEKLKQLLAAQATTS